MGKRSIKSDKNIYFQIRDEELRLTRAKASELMPTISESRLEKIEYGDTAIQPYDVLEMAKAYKRPDLCNYYCAHECPIGQDSIPEVKMKSLPEIVLRMISTLNDLESDKDRLIEITCDGQISEDEYKDFVKIQDELEKMSITIEALKLWISSKIANGAIDEELLASHKPTK